MDTVALRELRATEESQRFLVRFWGVRGSYPTPGSHTVRHGGNTSCIEVQAGSHTLILDGGSGIVRLGENLLARAEENTRDTGNTTDALCVSILITHAHGDHLIGIPFFAPLFDKRANIAFFGPSLAGRNIKQIVTPIMSPPYFPVDMRKLPSRRTFHTIREEQYIIWPHDNGGKPIIVTDAAKLKDGELCVSARFTQSHPVNGSILYRIEYGGHCLVYATDVEWKEQIEPEFLTFAQGADLLIHDAQYTNEDYQQAKHGFGHSTIEMATSAAMAAKVSTLVLFHHEPTYDDAKLDAMEAEARTRFARTYSACEGMEIDLLASIQ